MKRFMFLASAVSLIFGLPASTASGGEPCRFLSADFPKIAERSRSGAVWDHDTLENFLSDPAQSHARILVSGEDQECVVFQKMPAAETLRRILAEIQPDAGIDTQDWEDFLDALSQLTCEALLENGERISCPTARLDNFIKGAREAALKVTTYSSCYAKIAPEDGDLPADRGACTDVVIRGLRKAGIDLQDLVNKSIMEHFDLYNLATWSQTSPDRNIDHRRVANLMVYFKLDKERFATLVKPDRNWMPGDIVVWNLRNDRGFFPHIGVISDRKASDGQYMVIHHLPVLDREDGVLHDWKIIGHFRPLI